MATNFDNGISTMGVPLMPQYVVGWGGNHYFVDPKSGSNGNSGKSPKQAVKDITAAYALTADESDDVIHLLARGGSSTNEYTSRLSETLVWAKNRVHLVGHAAPTGISPRARISTASGQALAIDPMIQVTGSGNVFANFQVYNGIDAAVAANGIEVTGGRNYFYRVHIVGIGNAKNDVANAYSLKLTGGGENLFEQCTIGADTIAKGSLADSELMLATLTARNRFWGCDIRTFAEAATHQFMLIGAGAIEREVEFRGCKFFNPSTSTSAVAMTEAIDINASQNGIVTLIDCTLIGADDWEAGDEGLSFIDGAAPTDSTSGIAVATAA